MGFLPSSMLTMAHWPAMLQSVSDLAGVIREGELPNDLKQLSAFVVSNANGCRYCQAHTSHNAEVFGISHQKIQAAFDVEASSLFSEPEKAALRVALHAGMVPSAVNSEHMDTLRQHYSDRQCMEIVALISLFGFLNRWNDTMATTHEEKPGAFAISTLSASGWDISKH